MATLWFINLCPKDEYLGYFKPSHTIIKWDLEWENSCHIALVREKWSMMPSTYLQPHQLTRNLELQGKQLNNNPFSIICLFYKWETEAHISDKTHLCSWQMSCRIGTRKPISRALLSTRSPFIPRETRPGLEGHRTGVRRTWDCGPSHGPRVCLSLILGFCFHFPCLWSVFLYSQQNECCVP